MIRFTAMSLQSQVRLFNFGLILNILGMVLTDLWIPMVVGAIITTYLSVEAIVRLRYVEPMSAEIAQLRSEIESLRSK
ncbi:hypothetical protein [Thaumasiovibrio subtropicus]|uniref:hypothetical protein n=1 Tax=Thaumasiovibrio subtropicus TaxID=1891207 RepID=UPI000B34D58E|nr:hypothetical protein [Thaumasiovibrio subtropicus]